MLDANIAAIEPARRTATVRLMVVKVDDVWRLLMDGERVGRFGAERDALSCVHDMAAEMRAAGMEVEVLVEIRAGEMSLAEEPSWRSQRPLTLVTS